MNITEAVQALRPNSSYSVTGNTYEGIKWCDPDNNIPTKEEVQTKVTGLQAEFDAQAYSRKREAEYPSVQECVHAILDDDLTALQEKRQAVKTKYPKS